MFWTVPNTEILRIGDAGQIGGNDFELLRDSCSLSADRVSDSLSCCWNFAPSGVRQVDATFFYLKLITVENGQAKINFNVNNN